MGAKYLDEIEALTVELAKDFRAYYIGYRPVTTSLAIGIAFQCLAYMHAIITRNFMKIHSVFYGHLASIGHNRMVPPAHSIWRR